MIRSMMKYYDEAHQREDNIKEYISTLESGSVFYDLGANLGWFALYAASIGLKTYAFEVDDNNFLGLQENAKQFDFPNLELFNIGIADRKRSVLLRKYDNVIGSHRKTLELDDFAASDRVISYNHTKMIEVDSLDNIIQEKSLPYPDYLKVDIDGSEHAFLVGSPNTLTNAKSLVIELCKENSRYDDCVAILLSYGFIEKERYSIHNEDKLFNVVFDKNAEHLQNAC